MSREGASSIAASKASLCLWPTLTFLLFPLFSSFRLLSLSKSDSEFDDEPDSESDAAFRFRDERESVTFLARRALSLLSRSRASLAFDGWPIVIPVIITAVLYIECCHYREIRTDSPQLPPHF